MKVKLSKDFSFSIDGINIIAGKKGDTFDLSDDYCERLKELGVIKESKKSKKSKEIKETEDGTK